MIDRQAPAQRSGVLASLNMVADTLKLLPGGARHDAALERRGVVEAWPHGWLFLTSTPETRPRLVPLTSLWLDTLVLRLMNQGQPRPHPTWFVLDELASLQRLPQLHTAITENRKSNNPGGARLPGPQPARDALRPRRRGDAVAAGDQDLSPHQ